MEPVALHEEAIDVAEEGVDHAVSLERGRGSVFVDAS
jgi:hypothetical protein